MSPNKKNQVFSEFQMSKFFHMLAKDDMVKFFDNIQAVYNQILELDLHNKKLRKKIIVSKKQANGENYSSNLEDTSR